jgi:DNA-binding transcriptional LysR family regulator
MHRRHQHLNVPTEIVRTIVAIAELGSFSKAGDKLGLSQPAISAQVKRLQMLVGGDVFQKTNGGVIFTAKGRLVLAHARRLLDANDQILSLGGAVNSQPLRLGISSVYAELFFQRLSSAKQDGLISITCDHSNELSKLFYDGYLDIACLINPAKDLEHVLFEWEEEFVWVRSRNFVLRPGSPIPLIVWPGSAGDQPIINALEKSGLAYRVAVTSADQHVRLSAVAAGVGLMGSIQRSVPDAVTVAKEYYLPPLEPFRAAIFARSLSEIDRHTALIELLKLVTPAAPGRQSLKAVNIN